jgi:hypothetical protein
VGILTYFYIFFLDFEEKVPILCTGVYHHKKHWLEVTKHYHLAVLIFFLFFLYVVLTLH